MQATTDVRSHALACRRCGASLPAGPLGLPRTRVALDLQCGECGLRALYVQP